MKISVDLQWKHAWLTRAAVCVLLLVLQMLPAQDLPALNRDAILGHLNAVITWYRDTENKVQAAGLPSDAIYEDTARNLAAEVVRLAFQSARAEAVALGGSEKSPNATQASTSSPQQQDFTQIAARSAGEIDGLDS